MVEDFYRDLFYCIDDGFCIIDIIFDADGKPYDLRCVTANPAFEKQMGGSAIIGQTSGSIFPGMEEYWFDFYEKVAVSGIPAHREDEYKHLDKWLDVYAYKIGDQKSRRVGVLFRDSTARKRAEKALRTSEERQAYLLKLSDALRPLADPIKIQQTAMELIGKQLGAHRAFYGDMQYDEDTLFIGTSYADTVSPLEGYIKFSEFDSDMVKYYRRGETVVINDIVTTDVVSSDYTRTAMQAIQVIAVVGVPLLKDGKVKGILSIHQSHPRNWTPAEISMIEETAERTWAAVEQARAEEALRGSEAKFRTVFETMIEACCIFEMIYDDLGKPVDWKILEANAGYEMQSGLKDVAGKLASEVMPGFEAYWTETFGRVAETGEAEQIEKWHQPTGRWVHSSTARVGGSGSRRLASVFYDITERKRAEEALQERAEFLAEIDRAKTAFFTNISHEFRTPLTLILSPLEELLAKPEELPAPVREQLSLVHGNGLRLLKLVNTLLDFSRIEAGRIQAVYQPTDLAAFTVELASVFRSAIEKAGLHFIVDCQPLPQPIYIDKEMWEKIVLNLLSNAFKYTFQGEIAVVLRWCGQHIELAVKDTGIGIAPEEMGHLFERFHRIQGVKARTQEGTGIGLALVQELVKLHGGTVGAVSVPDQGTVFTVVIPAGSAHLPKDSIGGERTLASTALKADLFAQEAWKLVSLEIVEDYYAIQKDTSEPIADITLEKRARVLLADDNPDMRAYLQRLLSRYYKVEAVANGQKALEAIKQNLPDLVLADIMMPVLDGFGLLQAIRENTATKTLPVILLSARAGEESKVEGLDKGADDYLIKPFSARELLARVAAHLDMARIRKEAEEALRESEKKALTLVGELEKADQNKNQFISVLSHELRNPLAAILAGAQILDVTRDINQTNKAKEIMKRQTNQLCKLVDDLLELTRISQNKIKLKKENIILTDIVKNAGEDIRPEYNKKGVKLEIKILTTPIFISADPVRITQIIGNLLTNSLKFTQDNGTVWLTLKTEKNNVVIIVKDNGIGINPEVLPHLFTPFTQADNTLDKSRGGLGLGLSIIKGIVDLHGGTVSAHSDGLGKGSIFTIRLPITSEDGVMIEKQQLDNKDKANLKLLIIEDNKDFADLLSTMLSTIGYTVDIAYDGLDGLKQAKQIKPDVIFCDIGLPGMDGFDVAESIRNDEELKDIHLIALTGYANEDDMERIIKAGFNKHLAKPVDFATLKNVL